MTPDARTPGALEPKQDRSRATRRLLLDAAVDELVERGYGGLTTLAVARRAGVSRGAQQNHFPQKSTLVAEALRHLAERELSVLHETVARAPEDERDRAHVALDMIFAQFGGSLFRMVVELSLAAREAPELGEVVAEEEREMSLQVNQVALEVFGPQLAATPGFTRRWNMAVAAIRGTAMLRFLGHPEELVVRQWERTRAELIDLLVRTG